MSLCLMWTAAVALSGRPLSVIERPRAALSMSTLLVGRVTPSGGAVLDSGGGGGNGGSGFGRGGGGGGGGGDDDEASEFLRLLNSAEQVSVLNDWVGRSHIYKLTDESSLKALHVEHLTQCV